MSGLDDLGALSTRTLDLIFVFGFILVVLFVRFCARCCARNQRSRLRDDYEREFRAGGTVNALLLPRAARSWDPNPINT